MPLAGLLLRPFRFHAAKLGAGALGCGASSNSMPDTQVVVDGGIEEGVLTPRGAGSAADENGSTSTFLAGSYNQMTRLLVWQADGGLRQRGLTDGAGMGMSRKSRIVFGVGRDGAGPEAACHGRGVLPVGLATWAPVEGGIVSDRGEEDARMHYGVGCAAYQVGDVSPQGVLARVAVEKDEPHKQPTHRGRSKLSSKKVTHGFHLVEVRSGHDMETTT